MEGFGGGCRGEGWRNVSAAALGGERGRWAGGTAAERSCRGRGEGARGGEERMGTGAEVHEEEELGPRPYGQCGEPGEDRIFAAAGETDRGLGSQSVVARWSVVARRSTVGDRSS